MHIKINLHSDRNIINSLIPECDKISKESDSLTKEIETYLLLSNVKVVESFGYKSTEGVNQNINTDKFNIKYKLNDFFKRIKMRFENFSTRILTKVASNIISNNEDLKSILSNVQTISKAGSTFSEKVIENLNNSNVPVEENAELLNKSKIDQIIANNINKVVTKSTVAVYNANSVLKQVSNSLDNVQTGNQTIDGIRSIIQEKINTLADNVKTFSIDKLDVLKEKANNIEIAANELIEESKKAKGTLLNNTQQQVTV